MKKSTWLYPLICLLASAGCSFNPSPSGSIELIATPTSSGSSPAEAYFGLPFPDQRVARFAPEIFTEEMHAPPIFSPDGREVFWSWMEGTQGLLYMRIQDGAWTEPALAPFDRGGLDDSPFISADGNSLLFISGANTGKENIWLVEKSGAEWGQAQKLPPEVNRTGAHWQASLADNRNLYYGMGGELYFAAFENGSYQPAVKLGPVFNTADGYEGSPFIARDESYLIFDRAVNHTNADLYISYRDPSGDWGDPIEMGALNTGAHDLYANVSPDGRFLIFLSGRTGGILLPYWVDASIIADLRPPG